MVRLTADLIWKSPHFFNALRERELDLRGNKIPVIENLGATEDQFDTIDLSDNEIERVEAAKLFVSEEAEEEAKKQSVKTFVPGEVPTDEPKEEEPSKPVGPTPEQIIAIKAAIVNSQTLEEVARLEKALKSGQVPADLIIGNTNSSNATNNQSAQENDGPADMEQE
ncbi:hypothetical protein M8C21_032238 [Ambrosia artemisiifolia]|uniref:Uncharacterized protein n=1 Tax=Ambrosia artemisiifolia TaxID=4212 RepID=A0AAD5G803_AMBAR|nr:hypothetical protein M8C21_032238 [Ambrosia artemisiifolia]